MNGCLAALLGLITLTGCEGSELYNVLSPDWLQDRIDEAAKSAVDDNSIDITANFTPVELGARDNSAAWWSVFSNDVKLEPGNIYKVKFTNYGGTSNWKNFLMVLRNGSDGDAADYREYAVMRSDNWCWNTQYTGEESDNFCSKQMESESRDWATWLAAMSKAKCTALIQNKGDGTANVEITMLGADGVTYTQKYLDIKNVDKDNLYLMFTVEGSHIVFGDVEESDEEPVSMELNNVPKKVLQNTDFDELMSAVTATVTYADGSTKIIDASNLQLKTIPSTNSLGTKTIMAVYNKTSLGNNCTTPVIATQTFEVVDKMYTCIGETNNTTAFWGAHSEMIKVNPGETFVTSFTNYTSGVNNFNNFLVVLSNAAGTTEYGVLRADNWGWGTGWGGEDLASKCTPSGGQTDWAAWLAAMDGAKVTVYVTNNGNGTADVKTVMVGNDGNTYKQDYIGLNTVTNPNDFYFRFTVDNCHLEFDNVIGAEDNSGAFWSAHSEKIQVPAGKTYVTRFKNFTSGANNYSNFITVLSNAAGTTEYGVLRADNWGWGTGWGGEDLTSKCTPSGGQTNWTTWLAAMDGAMVTVYITNKGNGTADVKTVMVGNDGNTYKQDYIGLNTVTNANDFYFRFTVEACHLVFE